MPDIPLQLQTPALAAVLEGPARLQLEFQTEQSPVELQGPAQLSLQFPQKALSLELRPALVGPPGPAGGEQPKSPVFTYADGKLSAVTYADGSIKTLTYNLQEQLTKVVFVRAGLTVTKDFSYNPDGTLASIAEV